MGAGKNVSLSIYWMLLSIYTSVRVTYVVYVSLRGVCLLTWCMSPCVVYVSLVNNWKFYAILVGIFPKMM